MYVVCACYETLFTDFQGVLRDGNMLVPDAQQPPADQDNDNILYRKLLRFTRKLPSHTTLLPNSKIRAGIFYV